MSANVDYKVDENVYIPKWLTEMFQNWDRKALNLKGTKREHFNSLSEDAHDLIQCVEHCFTGYSVDEVTPEDLANQFMQSDFYLDELDGQLNKQLGVSLCKIPSLY